MKLFLCSHFSSVGSLIKEEIDNKKVAFIPTAANLWCRAGRPSVAAVNLALPYLLLPLFCLDHLTVKGGSVFLTVDFCAVGIAIVETDSAAV